MLQAMGIMTLHKALRHENSEEYMSPQEGSNSNIQSEELEGKKNEPEDSQE
jgi:hypothetical protein